MSLHCLRVDTSKPKPLIPDDEDNGDNNNSILQISQLSLFQGPKNVPVEVFLQKAGSSKFLVATLENPACNQFATSITLCKSDNVEISVKSANGKPSTVHVIGFLEDREDDFGDDLELDSEELRAFEEESTQNNSKKRESPVSLKQESGKKKKATNSSSDSSGTDSDYDQEDDDSNVNSNVELMADEVAPNDETSSESTEELKPSDKTATNLLEHSSSSSDESSSDGEDMGLTLEEMMNKLDVGSAELSNDEDSESDSKTDNDDDESSEDSQVENNDGDDKIKASSGQHSSSDEDSSDSHSSDSDSSAKKITTKKKLGIGKKSVLDDIKNNVDADGDNDDSSSYDEDGSSNSSDTSSNSSEETEKQTLPNKKAKNSTTSSKSSSSQQKKGELSVLDNYVQSLVNYLKSNGKTKTALLGAKCKKPPTLKERLGKILHDHKDKFQINGDFVELSTK